jgi:hypothetical protein
MLLTTALKAASFFVTKPDLNFGPFSCDKIRIFPQADHTLHVVATDGHALVVCKVEGEEEHGLEAGRRYAIPPIKGAGKYSISGGMMKIPGGLSVRLEEDESAFPPYVMVIPAFEELTPGFPSSNVRYIPGELLVKITKALDLGAVDFHVVAHRDNKAVVWGNSDMVVVAASSELDPKGLTLPDLNWARNPQ